MKIRQLLKSLQSCRDCFIRDRDWLYFYDEADRSVLLAGSSLVWPRCYLHIRDHTDVFVLLAYWVSRAALQCKLQIERWDGLVLDINAICTDLIQKCLQRTQLLWYNFLPLQQRKCHCTGYYGIRNQPMFSYHRWHWYHSYRVDEWSNAFLCFIIVSHQ